MRSRIRAAIACASLASRFALVSAVVLLVGGLVLGTWVGNEIETRVLHRLAGDSALYVEALLEDSMPALAAGTFGPDDRARLARRLEGGISKRVATIKVWMADGTIVYATDPTMVDRTATSRGFRLALKGDVSSAVSDLDEDENAFERTLASRLIETYIPLRNGSEPVVAVAEFYQYPDLLQSEIGVARASTWAVIAVATIAMYLLLAGMVRAGSRTIDEQRRALERTVGELSSATTRLREASAARAETEEAALRRVARELHDGLAQDLATALLTLDKPGRAEMTRAAIDSGLKEIRSLTKGLALPDLEPMSLAALVEQACGDHEHKTGRTVTREISTLPAVGTPVKIAVYRIVQEALSNAFRHAPAATVVTVRAQTRDGAVVIECEDDGPGMPERPVLGLGLRGIRERAELFGGTCDVGRGARGGTLVRATIPLSG